MELGISIVICTHNGKNRLELVLEHISRLHIPDNILWEVVVVDNASTDNTSNWINNLNSTHNFHFDILVI